MIDHLLFNNKKYILETDEVKHKLQDYDNLRNKINRLKGTYFFADDALEPGAYYALSDIDFTVDDNGASARINKQGTIHLIKK